MNEKNKEGPFYYEFIEGTSSKFWEITIKGSTFITRYGKIGTKGRETVKEWDSAEIANQEATKLRNSKEKKGYILKGKEEQEISDSSKPPLLKTSIDIRDVNLKELDKKAEVSILDYVVITDPMYLIEMDLTFGPLIHSSWSKGIHMDHWAVELKDEMGGLLYLVFGISAGGDDNTEWKAAGNIITIGLEGGSICVESQTAGIATFNKEAVENGWATIKDDWLIKRIKTPDTTLGGATKFYMMDYEYGNMEFWFDEPHGVFRSWEYIYYDYECRYDVDNYRFIVEGKTLISNGERKEFNSEEEAMKALEELRKSLEEKGFIQERPRMR